MCSPRKKKRRPEVAGEAQGRRGQYIADKLHFFSIFLLSYFLCPVFPFPLAAESSRVGGPALLSECSAALSAAACRDSCLHDTSRRSLRDCTHCTHFITIYLPFCAVFHAVTKINSLRQRNFPSNEINLIIQSAESLAISVFSPHFISLFSSLLLHYFKLSHSSID